MTISNPPPWAPCKLACVNHDYERSADALKNTLAQFDVSRNPRYAQNQQGNGETYCNIFVWDSTRALSCEIPHKLGTLELSALGVIGWLRVHGKGSGWAPATAAAAMDAAAHGLPVVITWENPKCHADGSPAPSHVAMMLPPLNGAIMIAQAGAANLWNVPIARGFGTLVPSYWIHS